MAAPGVLCQLLLHAANHGCGFADGIAVAAACFRPHDGQHPGHGIKGLLDAPVCP